MAKAVKRWLKYCPVQITGDQYLTLDGGQDSPPYEACRPFSGVIARPAVTLPPHSGTLAVCLSRLLLDHSNHPDDMTSPYCL